MKKNIVLMILIFIYFCFIYSLFLKDEYSIEYYIKKDKKFNISESYTKNGYYKYNISFDEIDIKFQINKTYNKRMLINKIYYYENQKYKCILPLFDKDEMLMDMICYDNNNYYFYRNIEDKTEEMINYVTSIKEYKQDNFEENNQIDINGDISYNKLDTKNTILLTNYKGFYLFNNKIKEINLFKKDVYDQSISGVVNNNYFIADYSQNYAFDKIYIYDFLKQKQEEIIYPPKISFNSYIQGIYDNEVYIYDMTNENQYKLNLYSKTIEKIGDKNKGIEFYDGEWQKITIPEVSSKPKFKSMYSSDITDSIYERIDKDKENGYYYFYEKKDDIYKVYRSLIDDVDSKIYIFSTTTIDRIVYGKDIVYFVDKNFVKCYSDIFNMKTIAYFKELEFNKSIKIGAY